MKPKRSYKDSLFRHIFNDKRRLASLYTALTGRSVAPKDITITTLRGVFFNDIKNDISFRIGDRDIILMEHQSSWNPNMPLRMLWYIAKLYSRQLDSRELVYRSRLIPIPAPEFYVFYNGSHDEPDYQELHLSSAFSHATNSLELVVNCYNINYSTQNRLLDSCYELRCCSIFVQKVRDGLRDGLELKIAIRQAITYCKTHDILADYFQKNESEVFDMVNFKWDQKRALEVAKEDGFADGERKASMKIALSLLKKGLPIGIITDSTNLSLEEIRKIAKDNGLAF
ncbi:Rpn family recombination-promoting nuclease/putative transposase [Mitsuokella sp. AF33-22]|uniref:Rpn family recombination-promoting nuclease/putative transposase n=1 Tax=Mitsuokella sp. AF33-22 TaxID=2292047 RepID=UPI000E4F6A42|nr:Rpn family recombination-promoting nuclease/putative transposase [Mitsuokella sp. AF33-22]RHM53851.1 Rpn family recombination-promoting nuclease/putative transposase [Mitsuokella sp. AF33-22]